MAEFDVVRDDERLGEGVNCLEAAIVFESWADVEPVAATKGPGQAFVGFVVDDDRAAGGADGGGVKVEGCIVVRLPSGDCWGGVGLSKEVESEFGLG